MTFPNRKKPASLLGYITMAIVLYACEPSTQDKNSASISIDQSTKNQHVTDTTNKVKAGGKLTDYSGERETCSDRNPWRNAYFGDLHIHTALSLDAYQQDVRTMPKDAYDFAQGKEIPFHNTTVRIDRPLDFAAVTDHAEYLGDLERCTSKDDSMYATEVCNVVRRGSGAAFQVLKAAFESEHTGTRAERVTRALKVLFESEDPKLNTDLCGGQGKSCAAAKQIGWQKIQAAAEDAYDRSAKCGFTTFVGYEYSGVKTGSNYHRNIIFRNANVPSAPISYLDAPQDYMLWQKLDHSCIRNTPSCDFLAIPHNSNLSNGKLLTPDYSSANNTSEEKALALLRQRSEPLIEIFQHKGQSECINGGKGIESEPDELCEFEQVRNIGDSTTILGADLITEDCEDGVDDGGMIDTGCVSRNDYLRGALLTGLDEEQRLGVNPLKLGVLASTDTHESTPGAVDEQTWHGHVGREKSLPLRLQKKAGLPYRLDGSPGGLAGVWAVENSRDALFDAMKRRETFGTSGPRIQPRFFASWSYDLNMCEQTDFVERAYEGGIPMGADLTNPPDAGARPRFAVAAVRDPEGNLLQRLQIIKGWIDVEGKAHIEVIDVAGDANNNASVDLKSGETSGHGYNSLCTVYVDEKFKPEESAYYYLRVVENPSLRWSWAQCIALEEAERPAECVNDAPKTIQERAWSSPIWYKSVSSNSISYP
jgi:Protein of unknown function (DUF3604)